MNIKNCKWGSCSILAVNKWNTVILWCIFCFCTAAFWAVIYWTQKMPVCQTQKPWLCSVDSSARACIIYARSGSTQIRPCTNHAYMYPAHRMYRALASIPPYNVPGYVRCKRSPDPFTSDVPRYRCFDLKYTLKFPLFTKLLPKVYQTIPGVYQKWRKFKYSCTARTLCSISTDTGNSYWYRCSFAV